MAVAATSPAAVVGLVRSDPHGPGITREPIPGGFRHRDQAGAELSQPGTLYRIRAPRIAPGWADVRVSAEPLVHIQATGVNRQGRTRYIYPRLWREQRDAEKFTHMLRYAAALPGLRATALVDLRHRGLSRDRVSVGAVRLIDLGLFWVGGERYAVLDVHCGGYDAAETARAADA